MEKYHVEKAPDGLSWCVLKRNPGGMSTIVSEKTYWFLADALAVARRLEDEEALDQGRWVADVDSVKILIDGVCMQIQVPFRREFALDFFAQALNEVQLIGNVAWARLQQDRNNALNGDPLKWYVQWKGHTIYDPFLDETCNHPVDPIEYYGEAFEKWLTGARS